MLVSNFTLDPKTGSRDRKNEYRLQVTNLEKVPIRFLFEAHFALEEQDDIGLMAESLSLRVPSFREPSASAYLAQGVRASGRTKLRAFAETWLPAGASGLVQLISELPASARYESLGDLSGFSTLRVPPARRDSTFQLFRQVEGNVRVLLHASHVTYRPSQPGSILDTEGRVIAHATAGLDDADADGITLASGKAENEIEADGWSLGDVSEFFEQLHDGTIEVDALAGARNLSQDELAPALLDLLAGIADDHDGIAALNAHLDRSGSKVRVETRD